jgi:hypothetical protein
VRDKLAKLAGAEFNSVDLTEAGKTRLAAAQALIIPNAGKLKGTGEFRLLAGAPDRIIDAREVHGDAALRPMRSAIQATKFPLNFPPSQNFEEALGSMKLPGHVGAAEILSKSK